MKPMTDYLLVNPDPAEEKTESGIILGYCEGQSEVIRDIHSNSGVVVEPGNSGLRKDDKVVFLRWGARELDDLFLIHKNDIIALVEQANENR